MTHNVITLWKAQKLLVVQSRMQCLICSIKRSLTVMRLTLKRYTLNVSNYFELGGAVRG